MSSAERPGFFSVEEYLAIEEQALTKSEYIEGWVRAMSGSTLRHNKIKGNCFVSLSNSLKGKPCEPFDSDTRVRIEREGKKCFYYPDMQVVCQSNELTSIFQDRPVMVIEVLSPSTRRYDLDEKLTAYLTVSSLQCYLILEQHQPVAIVMRRTDGGFLREEMRGVEGIIDLPFLGCSLSMRDIYEGIEFTADCVQESELEYELG
ncbi:MAG: Uma2 family endonuclease [Pirellulaceae bacterium]|nr:Uma2 family endonuclease [Pirellulaceae bacterium]